MPNPRKGGTYDKFLTRKGGRKEDAIRTLPSNHPPVLDKDADCPTGATEADPVAAAAIAQERCNKTFVQQDPPDYAAGAACYREQRKLVEDDEGEREAAAAAAAAAAVGSAGSAGSAGSTGSTGSSGNADATVSPLPTLVRLMVGESHCLFHLGEKYAAAELLEQAANILPFVGGPDEDELAALVVSAERTASV